MVDLGDGVFILQTLFATGPPSSCEDASDVNDDGRLELSDPIGLLGHLFGQTGPLPEPYGQCGEDPTEDYFDCLEYAGCEP